MKMEKTPRYTQRERNMVLGFAAQYKDVIENKRTDAESNRKKDEVWRQIAKEFNARVYHQRSSKQLRQLYKNMKLLLKKDLCGEGKGNRSFMDLLNTLSQQESVAQYISEQMSPDGYSVGRPQAYDDDFDDSKFPSQIDGMDSDVIVIKSEDISDNDLSQSGLNNDMDDDDDDCLSTKDIPEVCLEEEDDEIFATDLRQTLQQHNIRRESQTNAQQQQQQQNTHQHPEVTIQNVGGIRVGSIGSMANMKALENGHSSLSITRTSGHNNNTNGSNTNNQSSSEQAAQRLLLNGLGLSAVQTQPQMPTLQRGHNMSNNTSSLLLGLNNGNSFIGSKSTHTSNGNVSSTIGNNSNMYNTHNNNNTNNHNNNSRNNDYLMSLAIEERKRKIDLLNAQIDYWKTLTKKLDDNTGHTPNPTCMCHFPGNLNGLQAQGSTS